MYRYWTSTTLGDIDDVEGYEQELIKFYKQIRTQELYEVKNVMGFLEEVAIWLCCAVNDVEGRSQDLKAVSFPSSYFTPTVEDNSARSAISGGPDIILEAYKLLDVTGFYGTDGSALLFSEALESTWQSRKIKLNDVTEKTAKAILDNVNGEKDECM